jgi:predicted RNA-binding protein (virulence factor B family)
MAIIGKRNTLGIVRESAPGLYLDGGELGEILLPGRYIPVDLKPKDKLDMFVYRDSEDRLVATTETPLAMVGEFHRSTISRSTAKGSLDKVFTP